MGKESITFEDLIQIVQLIESSSHFRELHLKVGDIEIDLTSKMNGDDREGRREASPAPAAARGGEVSEAIEIAVVETARATPDLRFSEGSVIVRSPMVGTFYRAPEPGAEPFVSVGSRVKPDTIVCIIEVMKLMNSVAAGVHGVVERVLVENAHMVEYGQPLIAIRVNK